MRECRRCGRSLPPEAFRRRRDDDRLNSYCEPCMRNAKRLSAFKRRLQLIALLGDRCRRCGYDSDPRAFQIDHVNGDGAEERRRGVQASTRAFFELVQRQPERYQLLCANCNQIKRYEHGECGRPANTQF